MRILLAEVEWVRALARVLVEDVHLAEDAAQETWVAVLRDRPRHDANLRGWLAQVTRNAIRKARRAEGRRLARERDGARSDPHPSTLEVVERFSAQHRVASAVMGLEEPYRRTVLLRYYEDLALREIARRTGVSVSAVEWRLQRAREMLRRALDREYGGDGGSWALSLAAVLRDSPVRTATAGAGAGGLLAAKLTAALLVVAAGGFGVRALWSTVEEVPAPTLLDTGVAGALGDDTGVPPRAPAEEGAFPARVPVGPPRFEPAANETPALGGLDVAVVYPDGSPAAGIAVGVHPEDSARVGPLPAARRTRGDGLARFRGLPPGPYRVQCMLGGARDTVVRAEETTALELRLPPGPALEGVVVDARGRPVPRAVLWISPQGAERFVGGTLVTTAVDAGAVRHADGDGRFALPSAGRARLVGAWAEGHGPSLPHDLSLGVGERRRVRLVLSGSGGEVRGVVRTLAGEPVAGAAVYLDALGSERTTAAGERIEILAPMLVAHSDTAGRFRFPSVRPGARRMIVRAPGLARWRQSTDVRAGDVCFVEVRLEEGMRCTGSVTDAAGVPVPGALVYGARRRWWELPDPRHATATRTAFDGTFDLRGLEPGACWLTVDGGTRGEHVELFLGDADTTLHADIRLHRGLELRGRVRDAEGAPLPRLTVRAAADGTWWWRTVETDDDGRFAFTNCEEEPYRLRIEEQDVVVVRRVLTPGPTETAIVVPDDMRPLAFVTGTLVDGGDHEVRAREARIVDLDTGRSTSVAVAECADGFFRTAGIRPGPYRVTVLAEGYAPLSVDETCLLSAGSTFDLGVRRMERAARLDLALARRDGAELLDFHARLFDGAGELVHSWSLADAALALPLSVYLAAGEYVLCAWADGAAPAREEFRVTAADARRIALTLEGGTPCTLRFRTADGPWTRCLVQLVVTRGDGVRVLDADLHAGASSGRECAITLTLRPGTYVVEATAGTGERGSRTFTVGSDPRAPESFDCLLRGSTSPPPSPSTGDAR